MHRTALLAGSTGLVGQLLIRRLIIHPAYGAARAIDRRQPDDDPRVEWLRSDFSDLDEINEQLAVDDVYCCLGTTVQKAGSLGGYEAVDYGMVVDLARATRKAGANRFIMLEPMTSSIWSPLFSHRVKARAVREVAKLGFDAVHILRPSLIIGAHEDFRFWDDFWQQTIAPWASELLMGPFERLKPVPVDAVAKAMVDLALHGPSGVHRHHFPLKTTELTD
jgi:uncharacterized protein YbjT (DUF2867 family)